MNEEGDRELLGFQCADSESGREWESFSNSQKNRGLSEVDLVICRAHKGVVQAVRKCFQGATCQRCKTHFSKNILDVCPKKPKRAFHEALRSMYGADDHMTAVMIRATSKALSGKRFESHGDAERRA